jgi:hypothetical protein
MDARATVRIGVYAVRRSLERMRDKRRKILDDPRDFLETTEIPDDPDERRREREAYVEKSRTPRPADPATLKEDRPDRPSITKRAPWSS